MEKNSKEFKLRKLKRLQVSGAFHSNLMLPAIEPFKKSLQKCKVEDPIISVHSNVDGKRYRDAAHIKKQLPKQVSFIPLNRRPEITTAFFYKY